MLISRTTGSASVVPELFTPMSRKQFSGCARVRPLSTFGGSMGIVPGSPSAMAW